MKQLLWILFLNICLTFSCSNTDLQKQNVDSLNRDTTSIKVVEYDSKTSNDQLNKYIHTENRFLDTINSGLLIQNSFPKGGAYVDKKGKQYGYGIFFSSITNELALPVEVNIKFPITSQPISDSQNTRVSIFLPLDTLTLDKLDLFDYGIEDLSFFENANERHKYLNLRLAPNRRRDIYVGVLFCQPGQGAVRTNFELKHNQLFYRINYPFENWSELIPCGEVRVLQSK